MPFTGERTEWPGNVVVSKHVSAHASSEMTNYVEKLYRLRTNVIRKLMLFIKLTGGSFLQGVFFNLQSFGFFKRTLYFQTASAGVC